MKKTFFIAAMFLTAAAFGQYGSDSKPYEIGVKGGVSLGYAINSFKDFKSKDMRMGAIAGLYGRYYFTDFFAIQPELLYVQKGGKQAIDSKTSQITKLDYMQLPLLLDFNIKKVVHFHVGPYAAYLLNAKQTNTKRSLASKDFKRFDYGISAGISGSYSIFEIGVRSDYGLANVGNKTNTNFNNKKNFELGAYVAVKF